MLLRGSNLVTETRYADKKNLTLLSNRAGLDRELFRTEALRTQTTQKNNDT